MRRRRWRRLEAVDQLGLEREPNQRLYQMAVGVLRTIAERPAPLNVSAFYWKLLAAEGLEPQLDECVRCGESEPDDPDGGVRPQRGRHALPGMQERRLDLAGRTRDHARHPRRSTEPGARAGRIACHPRGRCAGDASPGTSHRASAPGRRDVRAPLTICEPRDVESAHDWKRYYRAERDRLGTSAMAAMVDDAVPVDIRVGGSIVVPHTRLEVTGHQIGSAVSSVLASGAERVLALGVLHGARRVDREQVTAARAGDRSAIDALRGVHDEDGLAAEEFSLDAFVEMLTRAAQRAGRSIEIVRRYPFLVGDDPAGLPGIDELERLVADGWMLVVTTDPIHHGHAYGTAPEACLDAADPATRSTARSMIDDQFAALTDHRFGEFARLAERHRSDFRDTGPTMAHLVGSGFTAEVHDLALVDYSEALGAPAPSWVAGALVTV